MSQNTGMMALQATPEKLEAFKVIAASVANSGMVPGWDTAAKVGAGCWQADALGVHPMVFMQGCHPMEFEGRDGRKKVAITPKWEFEHALLRARLPGFDYEVIEETETACEIVFKATGRADQRVRYTIENAKQQGLYGRNAAYRDNPKEMLWKQVWHRGADRIGPDVVMGLPNTLQVQLEDEPRGEQREERSFAEVIDDVAAGAATDDAIKTEKAIAEAPGRAAVAAEARGATPPAAEVNYVDLLSKKTKQVFGLRANDRAGTLKRVSLVFREVNGGVMEFTRADQIAQADAKAMLDYLNNKYPGEKTAEVASAAGASEAARGTDAPPAELDDGDPQFETRVDYAPPDPPPPNPDFNGTFEGLCSALRKAGPRGSQAMVEHEPKSGNWWVVAHEVVTALGREGAIHVMTPGGPPCSPAEYERIARCVYEVYGVREREAAATPPPVLPRHANRVPA